MQVRINVHAYRFIAIVFFVLAFAGIGFGQHQGHQMPTSKPTPTPAATPAPSPSGTPHRHTPGMPMPAASPSPGAMDSMDAMDMGPLLVMGEKDMGIRVGSSETNVTSMGAMGSGTAWQPSSGPLYMQHWTKDDWLLMFHYSLFAGMNRQGGPRGATKFESANWFMQIGRAHV